MLYFEVDVEHGIKLVPNANPHEYLYYHDARLFRTDGTKVEAMYQENDVISWKEANPTTRV